jgi:hypothetical protein
MSDNTQDDIVCTRASNVMGIDSANPLALGMLGEHMSVDMHVPRGELWKIQNLDVQMIANVRWMHDVVASR